MSNLQTHLEYLDRFLDPSNPTEEQTAITEAFDGKEGEYKGHSYSSRNFRNQIIHFFTHAMGGSLENIRNELSNYTLDDQDKKSLTSGIKSLSLTSIIHIAGKVDQMPLSEWEKGERGLLKEAYSKLTHRYEAFRLLFDQPVFELNQNT